MSETTPTGATAAPDPEPGGRSSETPAPRRDLAQFGLVAALVVVAVVILVATSGLRTDFAKIDPIGPRVVPQILAVGLLICAVLLAIATARGSVPEREEGEDVDLTQSIDWVTVGALVASFVFLIATVNLLGWTISSGLFFVACARTLGSRTLLRDVLIGAVLGVSSFYLFYVGLGVALPAGILDGIL